MKLEEQASFGRARAASLAGLAAITIVLVINVGIGKISFRNPTFGAQLSKPQVVSPAINQVVEASPGDSNAGLFRSAEPKPKITLSRDQIWEVQAWLKAFNLDPGPIDGIPGPRTFTAVKKYESSHQRPETGNLDYALLGALRLETGLPLR